MALKRAVLCGFLFFAPLLFGQQFYPEGAQVISYFPQLADGGSPAQQWVTSFTFVNPNSLYSANGIVNLYGDDGMPLSLDFGSGAVPSFTFTVPPHGTVTFTSKAASPTIVVGWAIVVSTLPLQSVVQFRFAVNGVPQQGVSTQATAASPFFRSPATVSTGIAVANIYSSGPISVTISILNANGGSVGNAPLVLGSLGHRSVTVGQMFPNLPASFRGTVTISPDNPQLETVAWTLSGDGGFIASYPPSGLGWPVSQYERIWKVWNTVLNVAASTFSLGPLPKLVIDPTTGQINSFANPSTNEVHIFLNLAELISDSESELSFAVAHELGHIIQARIGNKLVFVPTNVEEDADQYGMLLSLIAGYDPYGAAGCLAKLSMASGDAGLVSQAFDTLGFDPHGSFNNRLALIYANMQQLCANPQYSSFCSLYKGVIHPHFPPGVPLAVPRKPFSNQERRQGSN